MRRNMVFAWVGHVIILVQGEHPPSDEEWKLYITALKARKDLSKSKAIAVTDGGALTPTQRREVNGIVGGRGLAVVLSTSTVVRAMVTALSWFNPLIKAFAPHEKEEAFKHLKLTPDEGAQVARTIDRLRLELKGGPKAA